MVLPPWKMPTRPAPPADPSVLVVTPDTTVGEIEEAIRSLSADAGRLPAIVGWLEWDKAHTRIDSLLTHWEQRR